VPEDGRAPKPGAFSADRLGNGWRLLTNCDVDGKSLPIVLIRSCFGVALLEIDPAWTPTAIDVFRTRLAEADFSNRFPGNLPLIHRQIRPSDVPELEKLLAEAFHRLEPLTVEADEPWEDEVEALLAPGPAGAVAVAAAVTLPSTEAAHEPSPNQIKTQEAPDTTLPEASAARSTDLFIRNSAKAGLARPISGDLAMNRRQIRPEDVPELPEDVPELKERLADAFILLKPFTGEVDQAGENAKRAQFTPGRNAIQTPVAATPLPAAAPSLEPVPGKLESIGPTELPIPGFGPTRDLPPGQLVVAESEALSPHPGPSGSVAPVTPASPLRPERGPVLGSRAWIGVAAAGVVASASLFLLANTPDVPASAPVETATSPALHQASVTTEPVPASGSSAVVAAAVAAESADELPVPAAVTTLPAVQASALATLAQGSVTEPVPAGPSPQRYGETGASTEPMVPHPGPVPALPGPSEAQAAQLSAPPPPVPTAGSIEPVLTDGASIRTPPTPAAGVGRITPPPETVPAETEPPPTERGGVPIGDRLEPVPEADPVEGIPFWTEPLPREAASGAKPLPEDVAADGTTEPAAPLQSPHAVVNAPAPPNSAPATAPPAIAPPSTPPDAAASGAPAPPAMAPTAAAPPVAESPVAVTPPPVAAPPVAGPPVAVPPVAGPPAAPAAIRTPPVPAPAPAAPPLPAATRLAPTMSSSAVEAARRRGEALVALGDISGARRFLERAALSGSGAAALAMAETFDPQVLAERGVMGLPPDRTAALTWYRRALELGMTEAAPRIATLEAER
jgi:hypothetical protein